VHGHCTVNVFLIQFFNVMFTNKRVIHRDTKRGVEWATVFIIMAFELMGTNDTHTYIHTYIHIVVIRSYESYLLKILFPEIMNSVRNARQYDLGWRDTSV
jgi:hypothetical protein